MTMINGAKFRKYKSLISKFINTPIFINSLLACFVFVFTFPYKYAIITMGLDSSYVLAINYIVANDFQAFSDLIFTFGPLGFLKYPLHIGSNMQIGFAWLILVRITFIALMLYIGHLRKRSIIYTFLITLVFTNILQFDQNIFGIIIFGLILYRMTEKPGFLAISILFTILGLFIKINIGFIGVLVCASFIIYDLIINRNFRKTSVIIIISLLAFVLIFWLLLGNPLKIFTYYTQIYALIAGNSSALSVYPDNNWLYIFVMFLIFLIMPLIDRDKDFHFILFIIALSIFAVFKYSFARQENVHAKYFLDFLILFLLLVLLYPQKLKIISILLVMIQISLYYLNLNYTGTYTMDDKIQLSGVVNFKNTFCDYSTFKANSVKYSREALKGVKLPEEFTEEIGEASIDFYPWELTYFYINNLNYKPRPTLQSGCLYIPPSIDKLNAKHMLSDEAPDYMIWTFTGDDGLPGIDLRYLLNSDGAFINAFLGRYTKILEDKKRALWQRTDSAKLGPANFFKEQEIEYDQWVMVPEAASQVLKIRLDVSRTFPGLIKSFLYKEGEFFIHYHLESGKEVKHKFSRDNAQTGLWIQPYIRHIGNQLQGEKVLKIKLTHTHKDLFLKPVNKITWYSYSIN
ncbi:MAG: hypothetical protein U9R60_04125 [Bacteroidota bacterium]|nr:hypothetical protein [Bacteroidota bacterium]